MQTSMPGSGLRLAARCSLLSSLRTHRTRRGRRGVEEGADCALEAAGAGRVEAVPLALQEELPLRWSCPAAAGPACPLPSRPASAHQCACPAHHHPRTEPPRQCLVTPQHNPLYRIKSAPYRALRALAP